MKQVAIGPLRKGGEGAHFSQEKVVFDIPQRITNSSSKAPYVPSSWPVRAGADDHKQIKSKGIDA